MKRTSILAIALSFGAHAAPAVSGCPTPPGVVNVKLPSELPPALSKAVGDIAMPGEPFDTIDVYVKGHKHSRYIFVWSVGKRWIVATERGGIALRDLVSVYGPGKDGKGVVLIEEQTTAPSNFCGTATKMAGR